MGGAGARIDRAGEMEEDVEEGQSCLGLNGEKGGRPVAQWEDRGGVGKWTGGGRDIRHWGG